jgi:hypothetical protein
MESLTERARVALRGAIRERDRAAVAALRSLVAAFDNATATPSTARASAVELAPSGVGAAEAERRALTSDDLLALAHAELAEHRDAADAAFARGDRERAETLRRQAEVVQRLLDDA